MMGVVLEKGERTTIFWDAFGAIFFKVALRGHWFPKQKPCTETVLLLSIGYF